MTKVMSTSSGGPEVHLHKEDECDPLVIGMPPTVAHLLHLRHFQAHYRMCWSLLL